MLSVQTVRIYPTSSQELTLCSWMQCARRVWNHFLEHRVKAYRRRGESHTYVTQCAMLTRWRARDEMVRSVPVAVTRDSLNRLELAFAAFFRRCKTGEKPGFPRFKGQGRWNSVAFREPGRYVRGSKVYIPKIGLLKCRNLRPIGGTVKGLRVLRRADRWFAQLLIEDGKSPPVKVIPETRVGIDVGLESFATLSTGERVHNPRFLSRLAKRMSRAQRVLCRRQKHSARREKARIRAARLHLKVADARKDFAHKLSKRLVAENDQIAIEKLNVKGLARGLFAKSVRDAAWSHFHWCLSYKAERAGKTVTEVDPRGTSLECSGCGLVHKKPLSERWHDCPSCGLSIHRDHNAALNILERAVPAVGGESTHAEPPLPGRRKTAGKGRRSVKV